MPRGHRTRCARDSGWCDGVVCAGTCPNAEPVPLPGACPDCGDPKAADKDRCAPCQAYVDAYAATLTQGQKDAPA